jgi:hypothetical protein
MSESTYESALSRRRLLQGAGAVVASVGVSPWLVETATAFGAESRSAAPSTSSRGRATTAPSRWAPG